MTNHLKLYGTPWALAILFASFLSLLSMPAGAGEALQSKTTAFREIRLFDGETVHERVNVVVRDGRIEAVGAEVSIPSEAEVIDGRGKTLLPGLIDSHTHTFGSALGDALRFGVTTEIDMFTDHRRIAGAKRQRESLAPTAEADLFSAGTLITTAGGHGTQFSLPIETLGPNDDPEAFVAARIAEGSDFIKIVIEDGSAYGRSIPTLTTEQVSAVIAAAKRGGKLAVVHTSRLATAKAAVAAGADGLVHLFSEPLDEELVEMLGASGAFVIPTLSVLESFSGGARGADLAGDEQLAPFVSREQRGSLLATIPAPADDRRRDIALANTRRLQQAGVPILAGTDAPNPGTAHGISMLGELELLVRAGLAPLQALRAATSVPARKFALPERGCIAAGCRADLLLVGGDPLADIAAMRSITAVWKNGYRVERALPAPVDAALLRPGLISDFDDGKIDSRFGAGWQTTTDQMMGGKSEAELSWSVRGSDGSNGALQVRGRVRGGGPMSWAGTIFFPAETPMSPVDASTAAELHFDLRGDLETISVMLFSEGTGGRPSVLTVPVTGEWRNVRLKLSNFAGYDAGRLQAIAWVAVDGTEEFQFELDQVGLIGESHEE